MHLRLWKPLPAHCPYADVVERKPSVSQGLVLFLPHLVSEMLILQMLIAEALFVELSSLEVLMLELEL